MTEFDRAGNQERFQGWMKMPLTDEGHIQARQTGYELIRMGYNIEHLYASPLERGMETARDIKVVLDEHLPQPVELLMLAALAAWKLGVLEGQRVTEVSPIVESMYKDIDKTVEGSESFRIFSTRFIYGLWSLLQQALMNPEYAVVGVTHSANFRIAEAWLKAGGGLKEIKLDFSAILDPDEVIDPGAMMVLTLNKEGALQKIEDEPTTAAHQGGPQGGERYALNVPDRSPAPVPPTPGVPGQFPVEEFPSDQRMPSTGTTGAYPRAPDSKSQVAYQSVMDGECPICKKPFSDHEMVDLDKCESQWTGLKGQPSSTPENYQAPERGVAKQGGDGTDQ